MSGEHALIPFISAAALAHWLDTQQIDSSGWGQGAAKRVADLWQELVDGESTLQAEPPLRCVQVVEVFIERDGRRLTETTQHFADGRMRARQRPPSEKLKPGEPPLAAARRCLIEELAIDANRITIPPQVITQRTILDDSDSYPGLQTQYTFYRVYLQVTGLPATPFTTPNVAHGHGDPVVAHQWDWVVVAP